MGNKDYKQGYADSMKAHEDFLKKQKAATQHIAGEMAGVGEDVGRLGEKIGGITDYITDQEKVELYKLNAPVDIAELEARDKELLWAVLYQLANDENEITEEQQNYLRAVQNYIGVKDAQVESLDVIEEISDVDTSKAILQAVLEFFYLGTHFGDYTEKQTDFLDLFNVNPKGRKEILNHIETIVKAVGIKGLAEKYGFVPAPEPEMESENMQREPGCGVDPAELQDVSIDTILSIPEGETVTYRNKRICVKSYISCDGTLEFINCIVEYKGELGGNAITVNPSGRIYFDFCSIYTAGNEDSAFAFCRGNCIIANSLLEKCSFLVTRNYRSDGTVKIDSCLVKSPGSMFCGAYVQNCFIEFDGETKGALGCKTIEHCTITGLKESKISAGKIKNCFFNKCRTTISADEISDCIFKECYGDPDFLISPWESFAIKYCQFIECKRQILAAYLGEGHSTISYCSFYSLDNESDNMFFFHGGSDSRTCNIENCVFDEVDVNDGFLIFNFIPGGKFKNPFIRITDCTFRHCTVNRESGIIIPTHSPSGKVFGSGITKEKTVGISRCLGLDVDGAIENENIDMLEIT